MSSRVRITLCARGFLLHCERMSLVRRIARIGVRGWGLVIVKEVIAASIIAIVINCLCYHLTRLS